jgi:transposase-like protein
MKAAERDEKFNEFKRMHQTGQLRSHQIASKLGISKNTLYNWRKKLKTEIASLKPGLSQEKSASPLFTRIISQRTSEQSSTCRFIEITVGNSIVVRVPETLQPQSLQQIFAMISQWNNR